VSRFAHAVSLYLDTSVIGGYYDPEFMADTRALWRLRERGRLRFVTSQLVFQEIARAPSRVRELMRATFQPGCILPRTGDVEELVVT
jgi:predicted nucleic acid-binding protein